MAVNAQQGRVVDRSLTDMEKLQLFFCALRAKAMAEDAMEKPHDVPPHIRSFARELESRWQEVKGAALEAPPQNGAAILREFARQLEERLSKGEADLQQSYLAGEDIEDRFVFWWLLHLYRNRALEPVLPLEEPATVAASVPESEATMPENGEPVVLDEEALECFQAAMELPI